MRAALWVIAAAVGVAACAPVATVHRSDVLGRAAVRVWPRQSSPPTAALNGASSGTGASDARGQDAGSKAPAAPPEPLSPFDDSPVIFTIAGQHFTRGERVIVTVCLAPDHSIARADIFESSGDSKFDQMALTWARRIRLREGNNGQPMATCGAVRVEVRPAQEPRVLQGPSDSLS